MADELKPADAVRRILASTPARLLVGRAGPAYRTATQLQLRADHAAARDAVRSELDPAKAFPGLLEVRSQAESKDEYLLRPDKGRLLSYEASERLLMECPRCMDVQSVIGDGLSCTAVETQAPSLLDALAAECKARGWSFGRPFIVRYARVGLMNPIGELLKPRTVVLLIGERPGLATSESLSAYLAYRPRPGHTDADRNLIANIHPRGVAVADAAKRIASLLDSMMQSGKSGVEVKEGLAQVACTTELR